MNCLPAPYLKFSDAEICDLPPVAEYRQRREKREESEGKIPERIRLEQEKIQKIKDFDDEIKKYQDINIRT